MNNTALAQRVLGQLQAARPQLIALLNAATPGDVFSVSFRLDETSVEPTVNADIRWLVPQQELTLYAAGIAKVFTEPNMEHWHHASANWQFHGDAAFQPLAFFTLPPATETAQPTISIPLLLLHQNSTGLGLTLSASCGEEDPQTIVNRWQQGITAFFAPCCEDKNKDTKHPTLGSTGCTITPDPTQWHDRVNAAHQAISTGHLAKVVLARRLAIPLAQAPNLAEITQHLAAIYPDCHVFSLPYQAGHVLAASPEKLAIKRGLSIVSDALAGTSKRCGIPEKDAQTAARLLASPKEHHEHVLVVETIHQRLATLCTSVEQTETPSILTLRHVLHLWTGLRGQLREGVSLLDAALRLHPTPAVLGIPGEAALALLANLGEQRDCLYTGVAGWVDRAGDGDAVVILRSAYLENDSAVLWAGAGIVAGSDSASELNEIEMKLTTMREVLEASYA